MSSREFRRISPAERAVVAEHLSDCPVKLGSLAKALGVDIKVSSMPTGISGQISREGDRYVIRVNRNEARERQRFTIGHELSHYLLHRDIIDASPEGITDNVLYRSGAPENIEYEANRLAADLVMPIGQVERMLKDDFACIVCDATIESLADAFEVSKAAMEIRLSTFIEA